MQRAPSVPGLIMSKLIDGALRLNESFKRSTHMYMVVIAVVVGLLGGYGAVAFRFLIQSLQDLAWQTDGLDLAWFAVQPWYVVVLTPAVGGLVVGWIVASFAPEAKGHGVPEVMEAVALNSGRIRPRVVLAKALASGVCIATGGSVGREGPIVQIGSAIGSTVGQGLKAGPGRLRTLVGCGAAAGIAATFNAPVAGALFAVEVVLGDFGVPQFSPIVISSVAATVVSRHYLGDFPAFEIPDYALNHPIEFSAYGVLGLLAGLFAVVFVRSLYKAEDVLERVKLPLPLLACCGGAVVGAIALVFPGVLGVGYESINDALLNSPGAGFLCLLLLAKLAAVCVTIGSGGSGGVFAPSLFMGATLGAVVGQGAGWAFPGVAAPPGAYALVGMGAVVAAATHAPISAILILFELTSDYRIILPLMVSCIIATLVATRLQSASIYTLKLLRRGVDIRAGQDINVLKHVHVNEVVREDVATVSPHTSLRALVDQIAGADVSCFYVVDEGGCLCGVVSANEIQPALADIDVLHHLVVASDVAVPNWPAVSARDTLDTVVGRLEEGYRNELPVLDGKRLVGAVHMEDVLNRYRQELFKRELSASLEQA